MRAESMPKYLEEKYNDNFSQLIEKHGKKQKVDPNVSTNWLTVFYFIRKEGGISDIVKRLIQENEKYFNKAIIYEEDKAKATSLLRELKNTIDTTLISSQFPTSSQNKKLKEFEEGGSRVLITDLESNRLFSQGSITIEQINFIINTKIPMQLGIFLGRMKKKLLSRDDKGVLVNIVAGGTSWNNQYYDQKSQMERVAGFNVKMQQMTEKTYLKQYFCVRSKQKQKQGNYSPKIEKKRQAAEREGPLERGSDSLVSIKNFKEEISSNRIVVENKIKQSEKNIIEYLNSQVFKCKQMELELSKTKLELEQVKRKLSEERKKSEDLKREQGIALRKLEQSSKVQLQKERQKLINQYQKLIEKMKKGIPQSQTQSQSKSFSVDKYRHKQKQYDNNNPYALADRQDKFISILNKIIQKSFNTKFEINLENFQEKFSQLEAMFDTRIYKDIFLVQSAIFSTVELDAKSLLFDTVRKMVINSVIKTKQLLRIYDNNEISYQGWLQKISGHPNILVLVELKNGNKIAAFSETAYLNEEQEKGSGFLMSLSALQVFKLKYAKRGKTIKQSNRQDLQFGNGQLIIKKEMKFEVNDRLGQKYFENENRNKALLGQSNMEGTFVRFEVHQVIVKD